MNRSILPLFTLAAAAAACTDPPDGIGIVIEVLADQPQSTDLGVALAVHARGGGSVQVSVERGTMLAQGAPTGVPDGWQDGCFAAVAMTLPFTVEISVRPVNDEALLFVSLFADRSCAGERIQSRIVAVHAPSVNPPPPDAAEPEVRP